MKQYRAVLLRYVALLFLGALVISAFAAPKLVEAQSAPEKIRLMADALRARDSGDLVEAKEKAEELIKIASSDQNVQRLLASINRDLDRKGGGTGGAVFGQAADTSVEEVMAPVAAPVEEEEVSEEERLLAEARDAYESGDLETAQARLSAYESVGGSSRKASSLEREIEKAKSDSNALAIEEISPKFVAQNEATLELLTRGRAQFLNGDYEGAQASFSEVEARDANNVEAKLFQTRIALLLRESHLQTFYKTREQMLTEVDRQWERPKVFDVEVKDIDLPSDGDWIKKKLDAVIIPQVNFSGMELTQVIKTLSELSVVYDAEQVGVNIIPLFNAEQINPRVNLSLRNLSLDRILQFVTSQVNFAYDVGGDAVTIQRDANEDSVNVVTEFFPISRATVIRLTGPGFGDGGGGGGSSGPVDIFAAPVSAVSSGLSQSDEVEALQNFFQKAGVNFELPGTSLAFDGEQLIVTQTRRNLERMRTILRNYNEVKQVEIEAKFLEVSQNDLEELGFDWSIAGPAGSFSTQNRSINDAFSVNRASSSLSISRDGGFVDTGFEEITQTTTETDTNSDGIPDSTTTVTSTQPQVAKLPAETTTFSSDPPQFSSLLDLAGGAANTFTSNDWTLGGRFDLDFAIRALSRKTGSDLMSAPKVTVLSGKRANIRVSQELRYPESYGDIESQAGGGGGKDKDDKSSGGSSISITAGTPQDFVTRDIGVELSVTPNVENDDTISLQLNPRVTEFEGFVEYGGPSIAISGGTTVTVPSGFYQPIFSTREISTEVTIFDGATVVMGGLTRDEVKSVSDKVPVLGDVPGIGRFFRSEGETRQKRNLLIFVTANLVSPGGSPSRQSYRHVGANSLFQNPTIMTPSGAASRSIPVDE